ncbi:MAG: sensor domain-containing diguanylate cyclase, partial [Candidatus Limivicinus sp.]
MDKYQFDPAVRENLENLPVPFSVFQLVDRRVVALILSKGFCELFGYDSKEKAYAAVNDDLYRSIHPDDKARIADAALRFTAEGGEYNVVYRRPESDNQVSVIHAQGRHVYTETGARLAYMWYSDEGDYTESREEGGVNLIRSFNQMLREGSMSRKMHYDTLTGLPNMTYFFELAEAGIKNLVMSGREPAILFMDFSGMKSFNNKYGFAEGDKLIRAFGHLVAEEFGSENCARFGQDHFAVLVDADGVEARLEKLFEKTAELNEGKTMPLRAGIYRVTGEELEIGTVCDRAKMACDLNRSTQVSGYQYFDDKMLEDAEKKQYIIDNLDRA